MLERYARPRIYIMAPSREVISRASLAPRSLRATVFGVGLRRAQDATNTYVTGRPFLEARRGAMILHSVCL